MSDDEHVQRPTKRRDRDENGESEHAVKKTRDRSDDESDHERRKERRDKDRDRDRRDRDRDRRRDRSRDRSRDREERRRRRSRSRSRDRDERRPKKEKEAAPEKKLPVDPEKIGNVYIPPFKLAMMMANRPINDKSSKEYQKMSWDALRKSINGLINKVSATNIKNIVPELLAENLLRGRGLLCRSIMKAQAAYPNFTAVYAALIAVINTRIPVLGELLLKRLIVQFLKAFTRNDKTVCVASTRFIAHLVNQQVAGSILPLEIATLLLEKPTDDSVEVAVGFVTECGAMLSDLSPAGCNAIFERMRGILHEGTIDYRVQCMIESLFLVRQRHFAEHQAVIPDLDLVEDGDQVTHNDLTLEESYEIEENLNFFQVDPNFTENEKKYELLVKEMLGEEDDEDEDEEGKEGGEVGGENGEAAAEEESSDEEDEEQKQLIQDETNTNLINLKRTIYLTIMSSVDFEECAHKLLKIKFKPGQEVEVCKMLLECCSQERTYLKFYGLLAHRFCLINKEYATHFDQLFAEQYSTIHLLETNKLRNVAKFFAHLLHSDGISWSALGYIHLNEQETTSSSRIFIKILFQEIAEFLGLAKLNERLKDPYMKQFFAGLFPTDNPRNTRFAINFFTSIGLGGLTDELREWLKTAPKRIMEQQPEESSDSSDSSDSDSSDSSDSDSDSSDSDSSSSSSSDSD